MRVIQMIAIFLFALFLILECKEARQKNNNFKFWKEKFIFWLFLSIGFYLSSYSYRTFVTLPYADFNGMIILMANLFGCFSLLSYLLFRGIFVFFKTIQDISKKESRSISRALLTMEKTISSPGKTYIFIGFMALFTYSADVVYIVKSFFH